MMKSILAIVWMVACGALQSQTIYQGNIPCGKVRFFSIPAVSKAVWTESDTVGELSYTDLVKNETWFVSVGINQQAEPVFIGTTDLLGKVTINLQNDQFLKLEWGDASGQVKSVSLQATPSSQAVPVDYLCFTAHRDLLANEVSEEDSIFMSIHHTYPVPAKGTTAVDSARFVQALLSPFEGLPVDFRYPQDLTKRVDIEYVQNYTSMYEAGESEFSKESAMWEVYRDISVLSQDDQLMCWVEAEYEYTGGAHGNYGNYYHVFDFSSGALLSLNDLFILSFEPDLESAINTQLRTELDIPADKALSEEGFFVEVVPVTDNFILTKGSIVFCYNTYEIAPYVFGSITVDVPFSQLSSIISPEGAIQRIMNNRP